MLRLNFTVHVRGARSSKEWNAIALRIARAARGRVKERAVIVFAGSEDSWVLCENREPAKLVLGKRDTGHIPSTP